MFQKEIKVEIEKLRQELSAKEEEYVDALRSHKDYNTLRNIREKITGLKKDLESLTI